jgi:microcompartment protein CcmK/EutM
MKICRVLGPVVSTAKHPAYVGQALLIVQPLDHLQQPAGPSLLAVDRAQSGPGDIVLIMQEGNGIRQLFGVDILPIQCVIVGHVDAVDIAPEPAL